MPPGFGQGMRSEGVGKPCGAVPASCLLCSCSVDVSWEAEFSPTAPHQNPAYMTP